MISLELWRARIGTFNNKRCSGCSLSSSSLASSRCRRQTHHGGGSTDASQEEPSSIALTSPSSNTLATREQSQEFSSIDHHSTAFSSCVPQSRSQLTLCRSYGSSFMASSFSSTSSSSSPSSRNLHRSLLRDAVITLLIAIIFQLLMIAGDIETNPGPKHGGEVYVVFVFKIARKAVWLMFVCQPIKLPLKLTEFKKKQALPCK